MQKEIQYLIDDKSEYQEKTIYLTFDDGPTQWTPEILNILKKYQIKATFFINSCEWTGTKQYAQDTNNFHGLLKHQNLLKQMLKDGHSIGSHCHEHLDLTKLSNEQIIYQIETFQKAIDEVFQDQEKYQVGLIRPPFGACDQRVNQIINKYGVVCLWNLYSGDANEWEKGEWIYYKDGVVRLCDKEKENFPIQYENKCNRIINKLKAEYDKNQDKGLCILFHDTHNTSLDILEHIIQYFIEKNYQFQNLDEYCQWKWNKNSYLCIL